MTTSILEFYYWVKILKNENSEAYKIQKISKLSLNYVLKMLLFFYNLSLNALITFFLLKKVSVADGSKPMTSSNHAIMQSFPHEIVD